MNYKRTIYIVLFYTICKAVFVAGACVIRADDVIIGHNKSARLTCRYEGATSNHSSSTLVYTHWYRQKTDCSLSTVTIGHIFYRHSYQNVRTSNSYYNNRLVLIDRNTIQINNISAEEEGRYLCAITPLSGCPKNKAFDMKIRAPPSEVTMYSSYGIRGDSYVKLTCRAVGGYPLPRVAIYRHGLEISAGNQVTTLNYVIWRTEQNVTFQCKSKTQDITQELQSNAIKLFSKDEYVDDRIMVFSSTPSWINILTENTNVSVVCKVRRYSPQNTLVIYRHGVAVVTGQDSIQFEFQISKSDHEVALFCTMMEEGKSETYSAKLSFKVIPEEKPNVEFNNPVLVDLHGDASMLCRPEKISTGVYFYMYWQKLSCSSFSNLYRIFKSNSNSYSFKAYSSDLFIDHRISRTSLDTVVLRDVTEADEGMYRCSYECYLTYTVSHGCNKYVDFFIRLKRKPTAVQLSSNPSTEQMPSAGSTVKLICIAHGGYPVPRVAIYKKNVTLVSAFQFVELAYRIQEADFDEPFVCRSTTEGLTDIMESNAVVYFSRGMTSCPTVDCTTTSQKQPTGTMRANSSLPSSVQLISSQTSREQPKGTSILFTCTVRGGFPPPSVAIYRNDSMIGKGVQSVSVNYELADDYDYITFVCRAKTENLASERMSNIIRYQIKRLPSLTFTPQTPGLVQDEGTDISLTCRINNVASSTLLTIYRLGHVATTGDDSVKLQFRLTKDDHQAVLLCLAVTEDGERLSARIKFAVMRRDVTCNNASTSPLSGLSSSLPAVGALAALSALLLVALVTTVACLIKQKRLTATIKSQVDKSYNNLSYTTGGAGVDQRESDYSEISFIETTK